jgi:hypothetical protein
MKQEVCFLQLLVSKIVCQKSCNALRQDVRKSLCDELNGIMATFPIFDEISQSASEPSKGSASTEQLKQKRFFIKAVELGTEKHQAANERKLRIQRTAEMVQVCLQPNTQKCNN